MAKKSGKKRTHRQRRHRGGGWGFTGPSSIPGTPGTVSNPQVFTGIGDCRAVQPGYNIPYSNYGASFKGLPGMSGGKRTRKGAKGKKTRKQRGGRYGFFPEGDVNPSGQAWWAGSYAPIQRIACEGTTHNPLNPTHTGSSAPPGAANPNYWMKGGKRSRKQRGGAQQLAPATYGVGNVDSMYYYAPTAGYANTASTWRDSVGAPVQIQVPFAARSMNQACLTTGGHPPLTGALQKGGRRNSRRGGGPFGIPTSMNNLRSLGSQLSGFFGFGAAGAGAGAAAANAVAAVEQPVANTALPEAPNVQLPAPEPNQQLPAPPSLSLPNIPTEAPMAPNVNRNGNNRNNNPVYNNTAVPSMAPNVNPSMNGEPNASANPGGIIMGGRKRKHRKHKKGTHKRKH